MTNLSRQLMAIKCKRCNQLFVPPKYICPQCNGTQLEEVRLGGTGKISTYTTIRVPPLGFEKQVPYDIVTVDLAEGLSLTGRLVAEGDKVPKIGAPVSFAKEENGIHWFRLEG